MPTSPASDVVPVRKTTKAQLVAVKGSETFDDLIRALLDAVPPEEIRARLDAKREAARRVALARQLAARREAAGLTRTPEKQLMIAALAKTRWRLWREQGRVKQVAPRVFDWSPPTATEERVEIEWPRKRGIPPSESA